MGWMASWVGVHGVSKAMVLEALGFEETGELAEPGSRTAHFSLGELPEGWVIVFSEDFDWGSPRKACELSRLGRAVSLQFEDKVEMTAVACEARGGVEVWRISHRDQDDADLSINGDPPAAFDGIRQRLVRKQEERGDADYLHDIPIEVAKAITGYRADDWEPPFGILREIGAEAGTEYWQNEPFFVPRGPGSGGGFGAFLRGLFKGKP